MFPKPSSPDYRAWMTTSSLMNCPPFAKFSEQIPRVSLAASIHIC